MASRQEFRYEDCDNWTKAELIEELHKYKLKVGGNKKELCRRLADHFQQEKAMSSRISIPKKTVGKKAPPPPPKRTLPSVPGKHALPPVPTPPRPPSPKQSLPARKAAPRKIFTLQMCNDYTVAELTEMLENLKLPTKGLKGDLCERLANYYREQLPETKNLYDILIDDPYHMTAPKAKGGYHQLLTRPIAITGRMLSLIKSGPVEYTSNRGRKCLGIAYVFGPLLDVSEYVLYEKRKTSGPIAIINFEQTDKSLYEAIENYNPIDLPIAKGAYDLTAIQRNYPEILWITPQSLNAAGVSVPGEYSVHFHYNTNGDIDSLVIESNCLFTR